MKTYLCFVSRQEIDRMQRMLSLLRRTLTDLVMAIEGTIIMSDDLKEVLDNMFDAKVWQGQIFSSLKSMLILF